MFLLTTGTANVARADDDACIAASENEIPLRKQGKLEAALAQLTVCAARTCPQQISAECARRIRDINAIQPTIVLAAMDSSSNDLSAVTVTVDGLPFATALDGRAVPLDPGTHTLHFESAGMAPIDKTLVIREGEKERRVNIVLASTASATPYVVPEANRVAEAHRMYAEIAWGAGAVGLLVAVFAGIYALEDSAAETATEGLPGGNAVAQSSNTAADVAIGGLVFAAVGGVTGTVIWFTAPKRVKVVASAPSWTLEPMVGSGTSGVVLSGSF